MHSTRRQPASTFRSIFESEYDSDTGRETGQTLSRAADKNKDVGKWFKMLDWTDEEKFKNFGLDKSKNQFVKLSDAKPPSRDFVTPTMQRSRNARKSTVLGALVEESYRTFEAGFDQS